jgi:RNA polymerase sigma factor (sigma-70 family)
MPGAGSIRQNRSCPGQRIKLPYCLYFHPTLRAKLVTFAVERRSLYEMKTGRELLDVYLREKSEAAFSEFVARYVNLVYSVARRRLGSDLLAQDATQLVFIRLAKSGLRFKEDGQLIGWLHRTSTNIAIDLWRSESRRRAREEEAFMQNELSQSELNPELAQNLDEAINELPEKDRETLLLRFFAKKKMAEVGADLGISEGAAKMRVSRAVESLRELLTARQVTCAGGVLLTILSEQAVQAAPAQFAAAITRIKVTPPETSPFETNFPGLKLGLGVIGGAIAVLIVKSLFFAYSPQRPAPSSVNIPRTQPSLTTAGVAPRTEGPLLVSNGSMPMASDGRLRLSVIDSTTGRGIPNAKIRAAIFYAGGRGEGLDG